MKKIIIMLLILSLTVYGINLNDFNLSQIPANVQLKYKITETVLKKNKKTVRDLGNISFKITNLKNSNKNYVIVLSSKNETSSINFTSKDGAKSIENAIMTLPDGQKAKVSKKSKLKEIQLFDDQSFKMKKTRANINIRTTNKTFSCNEYSANENKIHKTERGGLIHDINSNFSYKNYISNNSKKPFLIQSKQIVNTKKCAYAKGNVKFKFPNMNEEILTTKTYELIEQKDLLSPTIQKNSTK